MSVVDVCETGVVGHPPSLEGIHPPGWGERVGGGVWETGIVGHPPRVEGVLPPGWREGSRSRRASPIQIHRQLTKSLNVLAFSTSGKTEI